MTEDMGQYIQRKKYLSVEESIQVVYKLIKIIQEIHETENILLCLYPDNIWIQAEDGEYLLTVKDRDLYSQKPSQRIMNTDSLITSVGFRAPELAVMDPMRIGKQTDYYSVAALFYYCLTGKGRSRLQMFHFEFSDIGEVIARNHMDENAGKILYRIMKKGLAYGLRSRYRTLQEMVEDLEKLEKCMS